MTNRFIKYFEDSFRENWDLPAMTNYVTKQTYAYKDVAREIAKLHILFRELNIQQDDKIALVGNNTPEWAITFLATITYGAVIVPILQDFHPDDIAHIIEHSESKLLFIGDFYWDRLEGKDISTLRAVFFLSDFRCVRQKQGDTLHLVMRQLPTLFKERYPDGVQKADIQYTDKDGQKMHVLNYTSGTTGFSKGVMLTGNNLGFILNFCSNASLGGSKQNILSFLPLAHTFGFVYDIFVPLIAGVHIHFLVLLPSPKILVNALSQVKPDWISMVPLVIESLYNKYIIPLIKDNASVEKIKEYLITLLGGNFKMMSVGGAPLSTEVEAFLVNLGIPFTVGYGMTECAPTISVEYNNFKLHSVGKAIPGVSVKVDSVNPSVIPGEILVKGGNVMKGYYKNEIATSNTFTSDGWLKTGDIGIIDEDGDLFIKGRVKNLILTPSGQNVYPEEIEAKLDKLPFVEESLVIQKNDKIIALVYPDYSKIDSAINACELENLMENQRKDLNKTLAAYEYVHSFVIQQNPFQKTPKNSIKRHLYI